MVRVKMCGITSAEDARLCVEAGADALGFNFVEKSPRFVTPAQARAIIATLPPFVTPVGIFWDHPLGHVKAVAVRLHCVLDQIFDIAPQRSEFELESPKSQLGQKRTEDLLSERNAHVRFPRHLYLQSLAGGFVSVPARGKAAQWLL